MDPEKRRIKGDSLVSFPGHNWAVAFPAALRPMSAHVFAPMRVGAIHSAEHRCRLVCGSFLDQPHVQMNTGFFRGQGLDGPFIAEISQ